MEGLERGVAQLLERIPDNLETDSDLESNDERQLATFAILGNPTSKWYTGSYPLRGVVLLGYDAHAAI